VCSDIILPRGHLLERIRGYRVALLTAPAGYGKSTLLRQAAEGLLRHELCESDRNPEHLRARLVDVGPGVILDGLERLAGAGESLRVLGEALAGGSRFLLAGRIMPAIPGMAQLRLRGEVVELGPTDLLFTADESQAYLGLAKAPAEADRLACGWPAALRLLGRRGEPDWDELYDYIESEVMTLLPDEERRWLRDVGILTTPSPEAVGALLERPDGKRLLRRWERLLPVDRAGRIHPLLVRFLAARLSGEPERVRLLHRKMALWQSEQGELEAALPHALAAGDLGLSVPLLRQVGARLLDRAQVVELEALLDRVEAAVLERVPELLLQVGEVLRRSENPRRAARWLRLAAVGFASLADGGGLYRAFCRLALTHADLGEWSEMEAALQLIEAELSGATGRDRAEALRALGEHRFHLGQAEVAAAWLRESATLFLAHGDEEGANAALRSLERGQASVAQRRLELAAAVAGSRLRVDCLGAFRVTYGEREVPVSHWGRAQVRTVLQYLLLQPGFAVPRESLLEAIWPGEAPHLSRSRLRVVLNRLRQALQQLGCALEAGTEVVRLPREAGIGLDLVAFRGHLAAARELVRREPEAALSHCRAGRELYRGPLLVDAFWPGVEEYRQAVARELIELLQVWEEAAMAVNRPDEAIGVLEYRLSLEPGQEEVGRRLMRLLIQAGRRPEALRYYREIARWLREELGLDPAPQTQALFRQALD